MKHFCNLVGGSALAACLLTTLLTSPAMGIGRYLERAIPNPPVPHRITPEYTRADRISRYYAAQRPWHGAYSYTQWGGPVALVVPPTASMQTSFSWGVAQTEMTPIYHQFHRDYPGIGGSQGGYGGYGGANGYLPTPYWPSHTDQLGVYPIRGPW